MSKDIKKIGKVAGTILSPATAGLVAGAKGLKKLLKPSKTPDQAVNPVDLVPGEIPTIDSVAIEEARRKSLLEQQARGGRRSTILSDKLY